MTVAVPPAPAPSRGGLPVLGQLSSIARIALVATLLASLVAIVLDFGVHADKNLIFVVSAGAILGLAWVVGLSTERLGSLTGPRVGGILNATFGNIAELIIAFFALQAGLIEVVKASLTGSIIGNLLLVLGASILIGGLRHGTQTFSQRIASSNAALLVLAVIGLFVPAVFAFTTSDPEQGTLTEESVLVAVALMAGYVLSLIYQFTNPDETLGGHGATGEHGGPAWTARIAIVVLVLAAVLLAVLSEILVDSIESFIDSFGLSTFFVGVVLVPTIGNLAEHLVAVQLAAKDKMEFAMAVSLRLQPPGRPVRRTGPGGHRRRHGPADGPRVHAAGGRGRGGGGRHQRADRARRGIQLARGRPADPRLHHPGHLVLRGALGRR